MECLFENSIVRLCICIILKEFSIKRTNYLLWAYLYFLNDEYNLSAFELIILKNVIDSILRFLKSINIVQTIISIFYHA